MSKARKSVAIASAFALTAGFAGLTSMGIASAASDPVVQTTMAGNTVVIDGETINLSEITIVPIVMGASDGGTGSTSTTVITPTTTKPGVIEIPPTTVKPTTSTTVKPGGSTTVPPTTIAGSTSSTTVKPSTSTTAPGSTTSTTKVEIVQITTTTAAPTTSTTKAPTSTTAQVGAVSTVPAPTTTSPATGAQSGDDSDVRGADDAEVLGNTVTNDDPAPVVAQSSGSLAYTGSDTFGTLTIAFLLLGIGLSLLWYQMGRRERAMN